MRIPLSSQAADLIRIVSWISALCPSDLFAIVMAVQHQYLSILLSENLLCLLNSATRFPSVLQTTYLTDGVLSSASIFCC
jgi:hypothetical protein